MDKYRVYRKEWRSFKSWRKKYFSPYSGTTYTISSENCSSFSCGTSSSLVMLTAGPRDHFTRWRRIMRRLSVCSVLRCPHPRLQYSVSFLHGLKKTLLLCGASFLNRAPNSRCTVNTAKSTISSTLSLQGEHLLSISVPSTKLRLEKGVRHVDRWAFLITHIHIVTIWEW
jgi:hypothetical protein